MYLQNCTHFLYLDLTVNFKLRQICSGKSQWCTILIGKTHPRVFVFYRKWRVRTRAGPWIVWCFIMTSHGSLKMTSLSPQLKASMYTDFTLTAPGGTAEAANLWNPLKRSCLPPCLSFTSTQSTRPLGEMPGCTSVRFTRNPEERIWRTLQAWTWKPIRIQIIGFCVVSLCYVTLSKMPVHCIQDLLQTTFLATV